MKSLIQAITVAAILAVPVASFAQSSNQSTAQGPQAAQAQAQSAQNAAQADNSGYGSGSHGTWQAGRGGETVISSYSPPIYNAR